jgi:hypothetical protein
VAVPEGRLEELPLQSDRRERQVSGPMNGVPAVYELNGREYLAVCVGAAEMQPASRGQAAASSTGSEYVVFALPRR